MSSLHESQVSRRGLLAGGAAVLLAGTAVNAAERGTSAQGRSGNRGGATGRQFGFRTSVGVQLYSVRDDCGKDLPGTIAKVAQMGYQGVEFAGYYGRSAADLKKMLDDNGIVCCGTHTGLDTLLGDNLQKTIDFNKAIGNKYLIVPGLPGEYTGSIEAWAKTGKLFAELAAKAKEQDMRVGYHNHSAEFQMKEGKLPWEVFLDNSGDDVVMQLDFGNAIHGGQGIDPIPYIYRYPGRAVTVHLKEYSKTNDKAVVGEGDIPWRAVFALCRAVGGTEWYIVEQESYATTPLESVEKCLANLREMRLVRGGMGMRPRQQG